ncbi:CCA tRNA nucleotidyltransferase [Chloroflexota bacterium]
MNKDLKLFIEPKTLLLLTKVSDFLTGQGIKSYLVGGFVRDTLLERDTFDIDITVSADALEIVRGVADTIGGKYIRLDEVNKIGRVVLTDEDTPSASPQWQLDFASFKGNIESDLAQRDFTIDAIAIDLAELGTDVTLIDTLDGWNDLHRGIIRAVSERAFKLDAIRLLRAVRLAAELGFDIDNETESLIRHYCHLIVDAAGERVREELLRLLAIPQSGRFLAYLDKLGLATIIIPELTQLKGAQQPKEHFWDIFDHSMETVAAVDFLLQQGTWEHTNGKVISVVPWSAVLNQHFELEVSHGSTRRSLLKLAALLHDIAKPEAKTIDENGRMRFLGHAKIGAAIAVNVLERLRFSGKEVKLVETMVMHHLRPGQMSQGELPSHRAIYHYFRDTGEAGIDILFLSLADHLATRGPHLNLVEWQRHAKMIEYVLTQRFEQENLVVPPKLVNGHDLIDTFGMNPGPNIRDILEVVREAQAAGELTTRQEALSYVRECLLTKVSDTKHG